MDADPTCSYAGCPDCTADNHHCAKRIRYAVAVALRESFGIDSPGGYPYAYICAYNAAFAEWQPDADTVPLHGRERDHT